MTRTITESQLRNIIRDVIAEEIDRQELDEGLWDTMKNVGRSLKGTFAGDANRVQQACQNTGRAMGNMASRAGRSVADAGRRVGQAAVNAGRTMGQAVQRGAKSAQEYGQNRVNAFKGQYQANKNIGKIQDLINTIDELQADGVLSGPKMQNAINVIKDQLSGAISRNKGAITGWQNSVK